MVRILFGWLVLLAGALPLVAPGSASAAIISLTPGTGGGEVGDQFGFDVTVSDLDEESEIVSGFDLSIDYDSAILSGLGFSFGSALGSDDLFRDVRNTPGRISIFDLSLLSDDELFGQQGAAVTLGRLSFRAIGPGTSLLSFSNLSPFSLSGALGSDGFAMSVPITRTNGASLTIREAVSVPEPSTLLLLSLGLLMILPIHNRRLARSRPASRSA